MVLYNKIIKGEEGSVYIRKDLLVEGEVYHVFTKSIAGFRVFNNDAEFSRMMAAMRYYQREKPSVKFSRFLNLTTDNRNYQDETLPSPDKKLVELIAFCLMPTHLHLILKQLKKQGISTFMSTVLNSYTRSFNTKYKRKGPLWEGRFKNTLVQTDEQLLHLTRYVHLNPVTAYLVDKPEDWTASSYKEYMLMVDDNEKMCTYDDLLTVEPASYRKFVLNRASFQRDLAHIKELLIDNP